MDQLLTVLIQTSPIPSHPSTALLEALFRSFQRADGLLESTVLIVCDGCEEATAGEKENNKHGKASRSTVERYRQHLQLLESAVTSRQPPFLPQGNGSIQVLQLQERHGSAQAIQAVFPQIQTPLIMVCQHDNFFVKDIPFRVCVEQMYHNNGLGIGLKCLHFLSTATIDYRTKCRKRYNVQINCHDADYIQQGAKLVPLIFWYGRTHISYTDHYRDTILNRQLQKKDHLEELLGLAQLEDIRTRGFDIAFPDYGTFVLDDMEAKEVIYHLSGRRVRAAATQRGKTGIDSNEPTKVSHPNTATASSNETAALPTNDKQEQSAIDNGRSSFTTARSCRAVVPGLDIIGAPADADAKSSQPKPKGRFRQNCFHCGQKGHSYKYCPNMTDRDVPTTETIDLS